MSSMNESRWFAPKEFAVVLGVHPVTVRKWIARAEPTIEVLRIGGIVRVRVRATDSYTTPPITDRGPSAHC